MRPTSAAKERTSTAGSAMGGAARPTRSPSSAPSAERATSSVREMVSNKVSLLATDESRVYGGLTDYPHQTVDHSTGIYVVGAVHTQTIEGFWSISKRRVVGTFHKVSR